MSTDEVAAGSRHKAAVIGRPVEHSLSPVLHRAAYRSLGLSGWTYDRFEVDAAGLPGFVAGLGPDWVGLSVTMPGKRAALDFANDTTNRAAAVGAANTLVRQASRGDRAGRWLADCTDVDGVVGALRAAGACGSPSDRVGVVLGAGGTASAAVVALAELGLAQVRVVVREPARAQETLAAARRAGLEAEVLLMGDADLAAVSRESAVVVSTVPADATAPYAAALANAPAVLDVVYDPWPTPLAEAVLAEGGRIATGLDMLLHQAFDQVEHFTSRPAPREAMREALVEKSGDIVPLPLP